MILVRHQTSQTSVTFDARENRDQTVSRFFEHCSPPVVMVRADATAMLVRKVVA